MDRRADVGDVAGIHGAVVLSGRLDALHAQFLHALFEQIVEGLVRGQIVVGQFERPHLELAAGGEGRRLAAVDDLLVEML